MPRFVLACLAYLTVALPGSTLGLIWPRMQVSLHQPVGALGALLAVGVVASVLSSAGTGRLLAAFGVGPLLAMGTLVSGLALALEAAAPALWVVAIGFVLFGLGFGSTDAALNAHAAHHFGPREITWMHASYGLGATVGPLLVTVLLASGLSWRWAYAAMGAALAALALVFAAARRSWEAAVPPRPAVPPAPARPEPGAAGERLKQQKARAGVVIGGLTFAAVETGIESGAGVWGFVFLTAGRGLSDGTAGVAVSAYWAMMFVGRAVLGPVAERRGAAWVLGRAVVGVTLGAALMVVPGPAWVAVTGMMALGLAAAPIFPLLTLTTADRLGPADIRGTTRTVSLQVASSAVGSAVLPAGMGLAIGAVSAKAVAPSLLLLALAMCAVYGLLLRLARVAPR